MKVKIGRWAFLAGVLLAVLLGLVPTLGTSVVIPWVLMVLGLLIGFLNVTEKETTGFLVAAIALVVVSGSNLALLGAAVARVLGLIGTIVAPAAVVVALKAVWSASKD